MKHAKRHSRIWWLLALAPLAACTPTVRHFGNAPPSPSAPGAAQRFTIAPGADGSVAAAVRGALVAAGFQEAEDAPLRVELGFAIRTRRLEVAAPGQAGAEDIVSPAAKASLALCHRQAYVLTLAMVDRATGAVTHRTGATTSRCDGTREAVLPLLARTALSQIR